MQAAAKLDELVVEKVEAEKRLFANQLKEMASKLKIVEDKLNGLFVNIIILINLLYFY